MLTRDATKMSYLTFLYRAGTRLVLCAGLLLVPAVAGAVEFGFGAELGAGVKHNDDGGALILRGVALSQKGGGCGIILGKWNGDFENDVAGLTCEKRVRQHQSGRRILSIGAGVVDITASEIVNSDWALEAHLRLFFTDHIAFAVTHFSNAGSEHPNRGFNFLSLEVVF